MEDTIPIPCLPVESRWPMAFDNYLPSYLAGHVHFLTLLLIAKTITNRVSLLTPFLNACNQWLKETVDGTQVEHAEVQGGRDLSIAYNRPEVISGDVCLSSLHFVFRQSLFKGSERLNTQLFVRSPGVLVSYCSSSSVGWSSLSSKISNPMWFLGSRNRT